MIAMAPDKKKPEPKSLKVLVAVIIAMWLALAAVMAVVRGSDFLAVFMQHIYFPAGMIGFELISRGRKRREGESVHCAKCDYQRAPAGPQSLRCPECGSVWSAPDGLATGRVVRRPAFLMTGVALLAFSLVSLFSPVLATRNWSLRLLPTGSLIREVSNAPRGFVRDEWAALTRRSLSAEQTLRLAEGLLEKRLRKGYMSRDGEAWFAGEIAAQRLSPDLVERYFREKFDIWIAAPPTARVGETVNIGIGVEDRETGTDWYVCVAGFYVDDDLAPRAKQARTISGSMLGKTRLRGKRTKGCAGGDYSPEIYVTPEHPGETRLRLVLWVVSGTRTGMYGAINWRRDGEPEIPEDAAWSRKIEVTHAIGVIE